MAETMMLELERFSDARPVVAAPDTADLWNAITSRSPALAGALADFTAVLETEVIGEDPELAFGLGAWELDLRSAIVRSAVVGAAVSALLLATGSSDLAPAVLPTVLPLLLDLRAVRVTAQHEEVLLELRRKTAANGAALDAASLYRALDRRTRRALSEADFRVLLEALERAGVADADGQGRFRIRAGGDEAFLRISLR